VLEGANIKLGSVSTNIGGVSGRAILTAFTEGVDDPQALAVPGQIQVKPSTYELTKDRYVCQPRGVMPVKGEGEMETYVHVARRTDG